MNDHEQQKLNWWAQSLQREYVAKRKASDPNFHSLPPNWQGLDQWRKVAVKVMDLGPQPDEIMVAIWSAHKGKYPSPFDLHRVLASEFFRGLTRGATLTGEEVGEMLSMDLDPNKQGDLEFYKLKCHLRYWHGIVSRAAQTEDATSNAFAQELVEQVCNIPGWIAFLLNPSRPEVYGAFHAEAHQFLESRPAIGHAAIRLGFPTEMIFPRGTPYAH